MDFPTLPGSHRILNVHQNVPGVLKNVNNIIADLNVNIKAQVCLLILGDLTAPVPKENICWAKSFPKMDKATSLQTYSDTCLQLEVLDTGLHHVEGLHFDVKSRFLHVDAFACR